MVKKQGERGKDKVMRKARKYSATVSMMLKLPPDVIAWVQQVSGRRNSQYILGLLRREMSKENFFKDSDDW